MLGDREPVEAGARRVHELVERGPEGAAHLLRIDQVIWRGDDGLVSLLEVVGQVSVRDLQHACDLHGRLQSVIQYAGRIRPASRGGSTS